MRKSIVSGLLIAAVTLNQVPQANAGAFATELTQVLNHGQLVMSYIRQGQQLAEEIRQYADMVRNSRLVPTQIFGSIMADLDALASIVQNGMGLAYSLANLDAEFRTRFRGYGHTARAYYTDYRTWSQTSLDTTLGALRAAGLQGRQLRSEQAVLASLRAMSQSSEGRMQALQVANQIAEQQVQQLMKLRELMLADLSSKQAYQAAVIQQKAAAEAATERFFSFQRDLSDGRTFRAGWR